MPARRLCWLDAELSHGSRFIASEMCVNEPPLAAYPCRDLPSATRVAMTVSSTEDRSNQSVIIPVLLSMPMSMRRAARLVQPDVLPSRGGVRVLSQSMSIWTRRQEPSSTGRKLYW